MIWANISTGDGASSYSAVCDDDKPSESSVVCPEEVRSESALTVGDKCTAATNTVMLKWFQNLK